MPLDKRVSVCEYDHLAHTPHQQRQPHERPLVTAAVFTPSHVLDIRYFFNPFFINFFI